MDSLVKALLAVEAALEKSACDLLLLRVPHLDSIADYFIVASGRSDVQVQSIARGIEERLQREHARRPLSIEGMNLGHWIALDYDDVVIHLFHEPAREFYRLESNWIDAQRVALPEPLERQARALTLRAPTAILRRASE